MSDRKNTSFARSMSCSPVMYFDSICSERREKMDQQKIGSFLKGLRQERKLTQDQLAEHLSVSRRTVSRW